MIQGFRENYYPASLKNLIKIQLRAFPGIWKKGVPFPPILMDRQSNIPYNDLQRIYLIIDWEIIHTALLKESMRSSILVDTR